MKKSIFTLVLCTLLCFTGCNATLQTNDENVQVHIVGVNKDDYSVTFEHNGETYTVIDPELYETYKDKIGTTANAVMKYLDESGVTDTVIELLPEIKNVAGGMLKDIDNILTD